MKHEPDLVQIAPVSGRVYASVKNGVGWTVLAYGLDNHGAAHPLVWWTEQGRLVPVSVRAASHYHPDGGGHRSTETCSPKIGHSVKDCQQIIIRVDT